MVGVGLGASLKGGNQIWSQKKNTFILSNYNELVDIMGSEMETSCCTSSLSLRMTAGLTEHGASIPELKKSTNLIMLLKSSVQM